MTGKIFYSTKDLLHAYWYQKILIILNWENKFICKYVIKLISYK